MNSLRVLVTNARRRKAVPIIRALGKAGFSVVCADSIRSAAGFYSRYCKKRLIHPEIMSGEFLDFIISWLSKNRCDVIFPLDDDALEVFSKNRNILPNPKALLLPEHDVITAVNDKSWLISYAAGIGVPIPDTVVIADNEDIDKLSGVKLPAIIKPSHGSGARGIIVADRYDRLESICKSAVSRGKRVLVQERIPAEGEGIGYFAVYDRDKRLIAQFMHRRLREYPISGGPSTLREGIWIDAVARQSRNLLESLDWVGLAMVEYKKDPRDGICKLMEINPRFWGSIALPIFSGVNFPVIAARLTVGESVPVITEYPLGRRARWLFPGDILHLLASLRNGRWPKGFFRLFDPNMCYDILSLSDPLPAFALLISTAAELISSNGWSRMVNRSESPGF